MKHNKPRRVIFRLLFFKKLICNIFFSMGFLCFYVHAGVFEFSGTVNGLDIITHPLGYQGVGGELIVTVGVSPSSPHATEMMIPVQNVVNTWNRLIPVLGNIEKNKVPINFFDFESVALHELGHCIGLSHPNLASESGLTGKDRNFTTTTRGFNNIFDIDSGDDAVIGSDDDIRGDDENLHWFRKLDNNPFFIDNVVDQTTYSRNLLDLPAGQLFVANGDRSVAALLGLPETESVMQQGIFSGETRRFLTADDVATLRIGMNGLDRTAGTADDYTLTLRFDGFTDDADIVFDFDDLASFAACNITAAFINQNHLRITSGRISFNTGFFWYFNDELTAQNQPSDYDPAVSVFANEMSGTVTVEQGKMLSLTVQLKPGVRTGNLADYWVRAITPLGTFWLDNQLQFIRSDTAIRVFGGPLQELSSFPFFSVSTAELPLGTYTITFAVDDNIDGIANGSFHDSVIVTIQ